MPRVPLPSEGTALQVGLGKRERRPLPQIGVKTDFDAEDFGAAQGRALEGFGGTTQAIARVFSQELIGVQEGRNINNAKNAYNLYSVAMDDEMRGLLQTQGDAALSVRPVYDKKEGGHRERISRELGLNENARGRFAQMADRDDVQRKNVLGNHALEEHRKESLLQDQALLTTAQRSASIDPSPGNMDNQADTIEAIVEGMPIDITKRGKVLEDELLSLYGTAIQTIASEGVGGPEELEDAFEALDVLMSVAKDRLADPAKLSEAIRRTKGHLRDAFYIPLTEDNPPVAQQAFNDGVGLDGATADELKELGGDIRTAFKAFPAKQKTEQQLAFAQARPDIYKAALRGDPSINIISINRREDDGLLTKTQADLLRDIVSDTLPSAVSERIRGAAESELGEITEAMSVLDESEELTVEQAAVFFERIVAVKRRGISDTGFLGALRSLSRMEQRAIMREAAAGVTKRDREKAGRFTMDVLTGTGEAAFGPLGSLLGTERQDARIQVDEVDREVARLREAFIEDKGLVDSDRGLLFRLIAQVKGEMDLQDEDLTRANFEEVAQGMMDRVEELYLGGLDPRYTAIPKEDRPGAVYVEGKRVRSISATPLVVEPPATTFLSDTAARVKPEDKAILLANPELAEQFDTDYKTPGLAEEILGGR